MYSGYCKLQRTSQHPVNVNGKSYVHVKCRSYVYAWDVWRRFKNPHQLNQPGIHVSPPTDCLPKLRALRLEFRTTEFSSVPVQTTKQRQRQGQAALTARNPTKSLAGVHKATLLERRAAHQPFDSSCIHFAMLNSYSAISPVLNHKAISRWADCETHNRKPQQEERTTNYK